MSGGMPGCLHNDQDKVPSVVGLASSDLLGLNCLELVAWITSIVMKSSVRVLVLSFSVMVMMLKGYFLFTSLIMLKYVGSWTYQELVA